MFRGMVRDLNAEVKSIGTVTTNTGKAVHFQEWRSERGSLLMAMWSTHSGNVIVIREYAMKSGKPSDCKMANRIIGVQTNYSFGTGITTLYVNMMVLTSDIGSKPTR